mmetsp:Transcript_95936/g.277047  ORF Transcript_95936/g.277047 Transcript_95936/m.277047 type:complete len:549 (+) Transcript_95936:85-1731(+)|eukprot:CAMPEP_0176097648 /NCGR_PEP_ID=MMETSP0120_2-20121206/48959_1 /TAXON_ID=160619 /ORGANISM="Kryptoperidinium foliaceum, Strain CCMP 1326" /LENGTH=548 /DNA_ID=CAMNT_0017431651 /DNA_START=19 /DNA_END=1665 /DNA_ORIENTATION=-
MRRCGPEAKRRAAGGCCLRLCAAAAWPLLLAAATPECDPDAEQCTVSPEAFDFKADDQELKQFQRLVDWVQEGIDSDLSAEDRAELPSLRDILKLQRAPPEAGGYRFIATQRSLNRGDRLMRIPMSRLMHAGFFKADSSEVVAAMKRGLKGRELETFVAPQTWLAMFMLEQRARGEASSWASYLSILPGAFPTVPIFYQGDDWKWIEGSTFVGRVQRHLGSLKSQYDTVLSLAPEVGDRFSLEDFLWARTAISSRVFGWSLPGFDRDDTDFMVPLGDMFNHRSPKMIEWSFNASSKTLDYRALEDVQAGSELLISYGGKCNSQYLLHYGFTMPNVSTRWPPVSTVRVGMGLDPDVPDREARERWLLKAKLQDEGRLAPEEFELKANTWKNSGAEAMLAYARLLSLPAGAEFDRKVNGRSCRRFGSPPRCEQPMGLSNEEAALRRCLAAIDKAMAGYPTTLEEDEALLPSLSGVALNLVTLRRDEKVVLQWWQRFFSLALQGLELSPEAFEQKVEGAYGEFSPESQYLRVSLTALLAVERPSMPALDAQ